MVPKKALLSVAAILLIVFSSAIIYYLVKADYHATGVFWDGAVTGALGCLFIASFALSAILLTGLSALAKRRRLVYPVLVFSGLATAILLFFKPGDSDVWWYGAIAGFSSCLSLVLFAVAAALVFKLLHKG